MIEGRPRESLVQYENPIEVRVSNWLKSFDRSQQDKTPRTLSRRHLDVSRKEGAMLKMKDIKGIFYFLDK